MRAVAAGCGLLVLLLAAAARAPSEPVAADAPDPGGGLVFVTEDLCPQPYPRNRFGCDAISVFPADLSSRPFGGDTQVSPGRLAVNSDLTIALATPTNMTRRLYVLTRIRTEPAAWATGSIVGPSYATFGGIAFVPGGRQYLVATDSTGFTDRTKDSLHLPNRAPYYVRKYELPLSTTGERRAGPLLASVRLPGIPVEIAVTRDGRLAHVLTHDAVVHTLDVPTLQEVAPPIQLAPIGGPSNHWQDSSTNAAHASLSSDERYLVTNRWDAVEINVADLVGRTGWSLATGPDLRIVGDVALNKGWFNSGLLALHAYDKIVVYQFAPNGPLVELGRAAVMPHNTWLHGMGDTGPRLSMAWSGDGARLIAAASMGSAEFAVIEVSDGGRLLSEPRYVEVCLVGRNFPNDIWTANGLITPPVTPTASPTLTETPAPSLTPTPSVPATATSTRDTSSPTPTATGTPSPTPTPAPLYLPIALRERCAPGTVRVDVALVIDASTSMRDDRTSTGRTKLAAAIEAARAFVATLALPLDQAAVVAFNDDAWVIQVLTGKRSDVDAALASIPSVVRQQTRIDHGIQRAHDELAGPRRKPANHPVMIVLTDGLANPEPASTAVRRAQAAKAASITVFTIGLGRDDALNVAELVQMASRPEYFYRAPDGEDLVEIYRSIAVEIPCPAERFWGRR